MAEVSRSRPLFADERYLRRWPADLELADAAARRRAGDQRLLVRRGSLLQGAGPEVADDRPMGICARRRRTRARGGARALARVVRRAERRPPASGRAGPANGFGVKDMVGLVWEWTLDFDAYATTAELRDPNGKDSAQFCGGAAAGVADPTDYPAFMRYSMRASLKAELHGRQSRLSLRGRRAMSRRFAVRRCLGGAGSCARPARARTTCSTMPDGRAAAPSSASLYNLDSKWTTQDGATVSLGSFAGKPVVAAMGYTTCKDMCPAIVADMMWIEKHLPPDAADRVRFAFFSFDSEADTPERLKALRRQPWPRSQALDASPRRRRRGARTRGGARRRLPTRWPGRLRPCRGHFASRRQWRDRLPAARGESEFG